MKKSVKVVASLVPAVALASVVPAVSSPDTVSALSISEVVYQEDGQEKVMDFSTLSDAMLDGEGTVYDYATSHTITALGIGDGKYVHFDDYSDGILDGKSVDELIAELSENPIPDSETSGYVAWEEPGDGVVPEVVDIY